MGSSIRVFTVRGIDVKMHITFPLILVWAAIQFGLIGNRGLDGAIFGVVVTLLLFGIVVLHELGHSFAALEYGVPIEQIVLLPIGGVAQMGRPPDKPSQELVIAIAGPAVNFGLAVLLALATLIVPYNFSPREMIISLQGMGELGVGPIFNYVFVSNLFIGAFNLLPAFPMDGGRVLRALLALRLEYGLATRIAVSIGQAMAWLLGLWGFLGGGFFLILIAVFIYLGAGQEGQLVQLRGVLARLTVDQAYTRQTETLKPDSTLRDAVDLTLTSFQSNFPVCTDGQLVGLLTQKILIEALNRHPPDTPVQEVMRTDIQPVSPKDGLFDVQQQLSQSQVEALPVVDFGRYLGLITAQDIGEIYRLGSNQPEMLRRLRIHEA